MRPLIPKTYRCNEAAELNELLLWVVDSDSDAKLVRSYQKLAHICGH
jgi:hypothetical protein